MPMSATSSVNVPGVVVTSTPRDRARARSTRSVPTPLIATMPRSGIASIQSLSMPEPPPVTTARIRGRAASAASRPAGWNNRWTV